METTRKTITAKPHVKEKTELHTHFVTLNDILEQIQNLCKGMDDMHLHLAIRRSLGMRNAAAIQMCIVRYHPVRELDTTVNPKEV